MRILLVEDEVSIASLVSRGLELDGFRVEVARDGVTGLRLASEENYALLVLDIMLPGLDGLSLCSRLRSVPISAPILMLTARDAVTDRVKGLECGADDYLVKPFDFAELLARVRALLRRDKVHRARIIRIADLEIDTLQRTVHRGGVEIGLSRREFDLLEALAANEGRVLSRDAIHERVWMNDDRYSNMVDVYIKTLRKKVDQGFELRLIQTVRGSGYTLRRGSLEVHP